jgi:hypothetical protein
MQVTAGRLDPPSGLGASDFDWIKAGCADECLRRLSCGVGVQDGDRLVVLCASLTRRSGTRTRVIAGPIIFGSEASLS